MKMVVAYVEPDRYEGIREELLGLGFPSISAVSASGSAPEATVTGTYRGAEMETHSRPKARLECVVGDENAPTVVETLRKEDPERTFIFVVPVDEAYPTESVATGEAAVSG